jgi:zinc-ribbon domain
MQCSRCGLSMSTEDNFCRKCGAAVNIIDVPAVRGEAVPARFWRQAGPAVARGVALVAAGAALRLLIGQATRLASGRPLLDDGAARKLIPFSGRGTGEEVEILWYRRVRH